MLKVHFTYLLISAFNNFGLIRISQFWLLILGKIRGTQERIPKAYQGIEMEVFVLLGILSVILQFCTK